MNNNLPLTHEVIKMITENPQVVLDVMSKKGYKTYTKGIHNTNNFGIRISTEGGKFDDIIGSVFNDIDGMTGKEYQRCIAFVGTTDPGKHYLEHPMNTKGTAILVPGQYFNFQISKHRGQYDALCQRGTVKVYRDNDKDDVIDLYPTSIDSEAEGINIHKTPPYLETEMVGKNSGGCQVVMNSADYDSEWMPIQYSAEKKYGKNFTYTLLEFEDFATLLTK